MNVRKQSKTDGFTLVELLVVIAIIGVLVGLLMPAMRTSGDAARRMSCSNQLRQLGLAMHNYHSANSQLPMAMGGTGVGVGANKRMGNANQISGLVGLLPFIEQQATWEKIASPLTIDDVTYPAFGPAPWVSHYDPWRFELQNLRCPTSPADAVNFGMTSYTFCIGNQSQNVHRPTVANGMFACGLATRFRDIADGLSNTIAMTEISHRQDNRDREIAGCIAIEQPSVMLAQLERVNDLLDRDRPHLFSDQVQLARYGRGSRWADGAAGYSLMQTILPPNGANLAVNGSVKVDGIYSAGSFHPVGAHVLIGDGAVKFIVDSIDHPRNGVGLWSALGSASGNETVDVDD